MYEPKPTTSAAPAHPVHIRGAHDFEVIIWQTVATVAGVWALSVFALAVVAHARGWI